MLKNNRAKLSEHEIQNMMERYFSLKDPKFRNDILIKLNLNLPKEGKEFFYKAFKKERYLDIKLAAVRGYSNYSTEEEVEPLMSKMLELLKKRPERTKYDYEEYGLMRSEFLMQYLIKKYNYKCFQVFNNQLEKQYNEMPDCFKDIYSIDESGNYYDIRNPEEVRKSWDDFFENNE